MQGCLLSIATKVLVVDLYSSTALMQVCKRGASSARAIGLNEMRGRGSGKAACVSSAKIFCSVQFFEQGPVLSSKCSAEVLDGQLVSAVLRSSASRQNHRG